MSTTPHVEYWLAGPIDGITPMLQPVAHAMLQARREINEVMQGFPSELLALKPGGVASVGFHLQHIPGFIDRLFTYAAGNALSDDQMAYLQSEGSIDNQTSPDQLLRKLNGQVDKAIKLLLL